MLAIWVALDSESVRIEPDRMDVNPDTSAVREIIDDALNGRRVFAETADDRRAA